MKTNDSSGDCFFAKGDLSLVARNECVFELNWDAIRERFSVFSGSFARENVCVYHAGIIRCFCLHHAIDSIV